MVIDVLRAYVQVASGLTELTRERAMTAAKALISQASTLSDAPAESSAQVRALAEVQWREGATVVRSTSAGTRAGAPSDVGGSQASCPLS